MTTTNVREILMDLNSGTYNDAAFYSAIVSGDYNRVKCILRRQRGTPVNVNRTFASSNLSPLLVAYFSTQTKFSMTKLLVEHGANVNYIIPDNGFTILHLVLRETICADDLDKHASKIECIKMLLNHGAGVNVLTDGLTPIHYFIGASFRNIKNNNDDGSNGYSSNRMNIDVLTLLLQSNGANVDCKDEDGQTALHYGIIFGSVDVVKTILLHTSPDLEIIDDNGRSPVHLAHGLAYNAMNTLSTIRDSHEINTRINIFRMLDEERERRMKRRQTYVYLLERMH